MLFPSRKLLTLVNSKYIESMTNAGRLESTVILGVAVLFLNHISNFKSSLKYHKKRSTKNEKLGR